LIESRETVPDDGEQTAVTVHYLSTVHMRIPQKIRKEAWDILTSMIERIKFETGCISCRIYQDILAKEMVMVQELWEDEDSLTKHLRSHEYRNILMVADMASEPPEIQFHQIVRSAGMNTIEDALKRTHVN